MSNTTILNSKAMQTLLARSEAQSPTGAKTPGASFQQLLEGALADKAAAATSPAGLAKSVLASDSQPEKASAQLTKVLGAATGPRRPDAAKQLAAQPSKTLAPMDAAANDDGTAVPSSARASDSKGATATGSGSAALDATQLKQINAPALPALSTPLPPARESPQLAQARAQPTTPRPAAPVSMQPVAAVGTAAIATARGFAAVLAGAHVSSALPASLVDQASFDPSLQMSVTPQGAHLSMDTGSTGPLIAQLQITNGVADVRLTGDAATILARHGAELSLGLTAAGLQPGRLEITAPTAAADLRSAMSGGGAPGDGGGDARGETQARDYSRAGSESRSQPAKPTTTLSGRASRVHVKA